MNCPKCGNLRVRVACYMCEECWEKDRKSHLGNPAIREAEKRIAELERQRDEAAAEIERLRDLLKTQREVHLKIQAQDRAEAGALHKTIWDGLQKQRDEARELCDGIAKAARDSWIGSELPSLGLDFCDAVERIQEAVKRWEAEKG